MSDASEAWYAKLTPDLGNDCIVVVSADALHRDVFDNEALEAGKAAPAALEAGQLGHREGLLENADDVLERRVRRQREMNFGDGAKRLLVAMNILLSRLNGIA
jgi:hypothetical protein